MPFNLFAHTCRVFLKKYFCISHNFLDTGILQITLIFSHAAPFTYMA